MEEKKGPKMADHWWTVEELQTTLKDFKKPGEICKWGDANLPVVGQGAYRKAYKINFVHKLPKGKEERIQAVLKVVALENDWAFNCTKKEVSLHKRTRSLCLARIFAHDENEKKLWTVVEFIPKFFSWDEVRELTKVRTPDRAKIEDVPEKYKLLVKFMRRNPGAITDFHAGNLGFRKDGRPVIIDYGQ